MRRSQTESQAVPSAAARRTALEHAGVGTFELRGRALLVDDCFLRQLGFERDELPDDLIPWARERVHPDDVEQVSTQWRDVAEGRVAAVEIDYRIRNKAGDVTWVRSTVVRTDLGVSGTLQDITRFKAAQDKERRLATQLQESNQRLATETERVRTILDHAPVMIDAFDDNGRCNLWNRECERQLGFTFEQIRALRSPMDVFYPDPELRARVIETIVEADGTFTEFEVRARDGGVRHQCWANFRLPSGEGISVGYDVSESKRQAERLEETVASLRRTNEELEEFAYVVSHDLQAPLRHIRAFIGLIEEDAGRELPDNAMQWFEQVNRAAGRMQHLIRDLLAFCRADRSVSAPELIDLRTLAQTLVDEAPPEMTLDVTIGALPSIRGYRAQLERLFQNLIFNAARYADAERPPRL
jgi:PAS domain S-box-containing protein